jgi:hypothetical protein
MADNFLITGYWGEPHVTPENDRGINAAIFGAGRKVLPVGEQFRAEYIGNNTVRVYDGKLIDNGAVAGIPAGEYIDLLVPEAGQGKYRNDLIVFQYTKDSSSMVERGEFVVVPGTETTGSPADPALQQEDLLAGNADFDQMALWRVPVAATVISAPVRLFEVARNTADGITEITKTMVEKVLTGDISPHTHSAYLPRAGGTMTGAVTAQNNTNYTTKQVRNIILLQDGASVPATANGDIVLFYTT